MSISYWCLDIKPYISFYEMSFCVLFDGVLMAGIDLLQTKTQ